MKICFKSIIWRIYGLNIPATLRAGDTITWDETVSDYPATSGYTLAFVLYAYGKNPITITASSSGADYTVSIVPATSRAYVPGVYTWQAYVYKASGTPETITEKYSIAKGQVTILPDLTQASIGVDHRSHVKKVLDAIEALMEGRATSVEMSYSIGNRALSKMSPEELIKWRSHYLFAYENELEAEGLAGENPRRVGVRFNRI